LISGEVALHPQLETTTGTICKRNSIGYLNPHPSHLFPVIPSRHKEAFDTSTKYLFPQQPLYRQHNNTMSSRSYQQRTSSESSNSSSSSAGSYYADSHYSMDASAPRVEVLRCSRCAKCVETITRGDDLWRVSTDDASANGMVRFGHNLYYCNRCAKLVGYK